jgi:hypothetical protein
LSFEKPEKVFEQRCLAGSVFAHQAEDDARRNRETDLVQGCCFSEAAT